MSSAMYRPFISGLNALRDGAVSARQKFYRNAAILCDLSVYHLSKYQIDGIVQDCSNSSALTMELLQSCTKPLK